MGPVCVLGPPGIGKSTVALAAVHDAAAEAQFGDRRFFVRCEEAKSSGDLEARIAAAISLPISEEELRPRLLRELDGTRALLVLDNFETPWDGDATGSEALLDDLTSIPALTLCVGIRGQDRPGGSGLAAAWMEVTVPRLDAAATAEMFLAIATTHTKTSPGLSDILNATDGVPLAIGLMAGVARNEPSLENLHARWESERTSLMRRPGGGRDASLGASLTVSLASSRMTDLARDLLSMLSLFPAGVLHSDLPDVFGDAAFAAAAVLRGVGLAFDEGGRLRLLAPIREFIQQFHPPSDASRDRAFGFYLAVLTEDGPAVGTASGAAAVARLVPEAANLTVSLEHALKARPVADSALTAMLKAANFIRHAGQRLGDTEAVALDAARQTANRQLGADCILCLGLITSARSDNANAHERFDEALRIYRQVGDIRGQANCAFGLGAIAGERSDYVEASRRFDGSLRLYRRCGDVTGEANCFIRLGVISLQQSNPDDAHRRCNEALALYRQLGDIIGQANCMKLLGDIALKRSDTAVAEMLYRDALALFEETGVVVGRANCLRGLGEVALRRSDDAEAELRINEALALYRKLGNVPGIANCTTSLGDIAFLRSLYDAAQDRYQAAEALYRRNNDLLGEATCIFRVGLIALACSDIDTARVRFNEALALYERIPEPYSIGGTHRRLARISEGEERAGHVEAARAAWLSIGREDLVAKLDAEFGAG